MAKFLHYFIVLPFILATSGKLQAQFVAPTINGNIGSGEYGSHTNGVNQQTNGVVTYMTWDGTNLYVGVSGGNNGEAFVLYLDKDPQTPVNGGSNANGTNVGYSSYDGTSFASLPYRADVVLYIKNDYREYRTANGNNGWNSPVTYFGSYAENWGNPNVREFSLPWSAIGGMPASFNWFGYITSSGGYVYGQVPTENPGAFIGTGARFSRYYTVSSTNVSSPTPPFSRNSYVFNGTVDANAFGEISVYDFTMNSSGRIISRTGNTAGNWNIGGSLIVGNGTIYLGSGNSSYGQTLIGGNLNILGGTFDMDASTAAATVNGNVSVSSGATLRLSSAVGGDLNVKGNWSRSGTFTPNGRLVQFNGSALQAISGATTFDYLKINNISGIALNGSSSVTVNSLLDLTSGKVTLNANNLTLGSGASTAGEGANNYVITGTGGTLVRNGVGASSKIFPVGIASGYTPISLTNTVSANSLSVTVQAPPVQAVDNPSRIVNVEWNVQSSGTGSVANAQFQWNTANQGSAYNASGYGELGKYTSGPNYLITSLGLMSGQSKTVSNISLSAGNNRFVLGNAHAVHATPITWNGTQWSDVAGPDADVEAIIAGNYSTATSPQGNGAFTAKKVTVQSGVLTVATATNLTIVNELVNAQQPDKVVIENNANLLQSTNIQNVGAVTILRNSNALWRLDYTMWSSPVSGQNLFGFSNETVWNRFYRYNPASDHYVSIFQSETDADMATDNFEPGLGYLIRMPNTWVEYGQTAASYNGAFIGVPNNGPYSIPVTAGTYNAVGNPYPSAISADAFIAANSLTEALYFWRKRNADSGSAYATYTAAGGTNPYGNPGDDLPGGTNPVSAIPNGVIPAGQGFIAKAVSGSLNFANAQRVTSNNGTFFRTSEGQRHRIWLGLSGDSGKLGQLLVAYMDGATPGIDDAIDGKYINDSQTALTSIVENEEWAIQGRALPFEPTDVVSLGFKSAQAGTFTISLDQVDGVFADGQAVYLRDLFTGTIHDLGQGVYSFSCEAGIFNERFEIVYENMLALGEVTAESDVVIVQNQNGLVAKSHSGSLVSVEVFDVTGKLVAKAVGNSHEIEVGLAALNTVLVVRVTSAENRVYVKKVLR